MPGLGDLACRVGRIEIAAATRRRRRSLPPRSLLLSRSRFSFDCGSLILLCGHPDTDVRWTVAKDNAITSFAVAQVANGVTNPEDQVREVQHHEGTGRFRVYQSAQLARALGIESTAESEHDAELRRALNLQECHDRTYCNYRSNWRRLALTAGFGVA